MTVPLLLSIGMAGAAQAQFQQMLEAGNHTPSDPIAAAVAAAAEIAKNGGFFGTEAAFGSPRTTTAPKTQHHHQPPVTHLVVPASSSSMTAASSLDSDEDSTTNNRQQHHNDNEDEDDAERRIARSRERNREHARRTRLRKKAQLEALQSKVKGLQAESKVLKQSLEECSIASILVGLSTGSGEDVKIQTLLKEFNDETTIGAGGESSNVDENNIQALVGGKRKRFACAGDNDSDRVAQPLRIVIDGKPTFIGGGRTHINWKTGVYSDHDGTQRQLTQSQLESLRRERNRMHAKMTRDRKKNFIANIEKTISDLEGQNQRMKDTLSEVIQTHFGSGTTLPAGAAREAHAVVTASSSSSSSSGSGNIAMPQPVTPEHSPSQPPRKRKKVCSHGFSLNTP